MPSWSSADLAEYERRKNQHRDTRKASLVEPDASIGALGKSKVEKGNTGRVLVRVTSVRRRLLDEDNLCEKYHVDCCRYAGLISSDDPGKAKIEVAQRKAIKGEQEHTLIEIEPII